MFCILGEDKSDVETLKELIFRISNNRSLTIKVHGYRSCGEMLRKGARQLQSFRSLGCSKFIVCYDADSDDPVLRKRTIVEEVIKPANIQGVFCALVPIQEIEAWILADLVAVTNIIKGWTPTKDIPNPEAVQDPKEHLEKLSRAQQRPRYSHATHNPRIAKYLNLGIVAQKCPSFHPLLEIVKNGKGNV